MYSAAYPTAGCHKEIAICLGHYLQRTPSLRGHRPAITLLAIRYLICARSVRCRRDGTWQFAQLRLCCWPLAPITKTESLVWAPGLYLFPDCEFAPHSWA